MVAEQAAFNEVKTRLTGVQSQLSRLVRLSGNAFDAKTLTSSHEDLVTAAASNEAQPGVYQLRVNSLAKAHQISTQGFALADAVISTGELDIQVGNDLPPRSRSTKQTIRYAAWLMPLMARMPMSLPR